MLPAETGGCLTTSTMRTLSREVSTMNMPGFTADAAVYKSPGHYRTTTDFADTGQRVVPAALGKCGYGPCIPRYLAGQLLGYGRQRCCCTFGSSPATTYCSCGG